MGYRATERGRQPLPRMPNPYRPDYEQLHARLRNAPSRAVDPAPPLPERLAILSCIHANAPALNAVMEFLAAEYGIGPDRVICLGDIIGYGPDPVQCVDTAMQFRHCLMGCHEEAMLHGFFGWSSSYAVRTVEYAKRLLRPGWFADGATRARWRFLRRLPRPTMEQFGPWQIVHGSPRDPTMEYILKVDTEAYFGDIPPKMSEIFSMIDSVVFVGRSHIPNVITEDPLLYRSDAEAGYELHLEPGRKYIINVGSVGQPRDQAPRACVVVVDEATRIVRWHRVEYDVEAQARRIEAHAEVHDIYAQRLRQGL